MKCPKCHRDTYSKKWDECSATGCSLNRAEGLKGFGARVIGHTDIDALSAIRPIVERNETNSPPTSVSSSRGRKPIGERAMTSTERVRRHRARKASQ